MSGAAAGPRVLDVVLYRTRYCPYCLLAARLLGSSGIPFREVDVSADPQRRRWLARASGQSSVPQVFVGERAIGGYAQLREWLAAGPEAMFEHGSGERGRTRA